MCDEPTIDRDTLIGDLAAKFDIIKQAAATVIDTVSTIGDQDWLELLLTDPDANPPSLVPPVAGSRHYRFTDEEADVIYQVCSYEDIEARSAAGSAVNNARRTVITWATHAAISGVALHDIARLSGLGCDDLAHVDAAARSWYDSGPAASVVAIYQRPHRQATLQDRVVDAVTDMIAEALLCGVSVPVAAQLTRMPVQRVRDVAERLNASFHETADLHPVI